MQLISVIVSTYNRKDALEACILSLFEQNDLNFEIIIADDGSRTDTGELIKQLAIQSPVPLIHCYQEDNGFRAAAIRNKAISKSSGDYLILIDGDCLVFPHFVQRHRRLAAQGYFVPGNRIMIGQSFTETILNTPLFLTKHSFFHFFKWRLQRKIHGLLPLIYFPFQKPRLLRPMVWHGAMTCNLAFWKQDFIAVNGFDELFTGWGFEDSDFIIRLMRHNIRRKDGCFAIPVLHLWHPLNDRTNADSNWQLFQQRLVTKNFLLAEQGVSQYL